MPIVSGISGFREFFRIASRFPAEDPREMKRIFESERRAGFLHPDSGILQNVILRLKDFVTDERFPRRHPWYWGLICYGRSFGEKRLLSPGT